eukprot:5094203-Pyramimonas_sp.AAC.1
MGASTFLLNMVTDEEVEVVAEAEEAKAEAATEEEEATQEEADAATMEEADEADDGGFWAKKEEGDEIKDEDV